MFTLHVKKIRKNVVIPDNEFSKMIKNYHRFEPIEVIEDDDPDFLTEENLKARQKAMEELAKGDAISFEDWQKELRKREEEESLFVVRDKRK